MASNIIQRERRAQTQPIKSTAGQTQTNTSNGRRATYHTSDGTQTTLDEDSSYLATSTTVSRDSGLSSTMSSTLDLSEDIRLQFKMLTQEIANEMERRSDNEENSNGKTKNVTNLFSSTSSTIKHGELKIARSDSMDSGVEESTKPQDLETIHEIELESSDDIYDTADANNTQTESKIPDRRGLHAFWNNLFGRCFHFSKEDEEEAIYQIYDEMEQEKKKTEHFKLPLAINASSLHRPDSGYDSFKIVNSAANATAIKTPKSNGTAIPQERTPRSIFITELVQSLQQFQLRQRISPLNLAGKSVQTSYFAATFLTEKGGRISLPERNVNLYVPPGAIPSDHLQLVYIYVLSPGGVSSLDNAETWLSQSVHCGPSGLQFNKHVFLTVPHSATDIKEWELTTHQIKRNDKGVWRKLEDGKETLLVRQKDKLTLLMTHFCGQRFSGRAHDVTATKRMNVAAHIDETDAEVKINVCISNQEENITSLEEQFRQRIPSSYVNPCNESQSFVSEVRFRDLCFTLDFLESTGNVGWSAVAGKLGSLSPQAVHVAKQQKDRSPTAILLDAFFVKQYYEKKGVLETLELLSNICDEIESHGARRIINEEIEERRVGEENKVEAAKGIVLGTNETQHNDNQQKTVSRSISELPVGFIKGRTNNVIVEVGNISPGWRVRTPRRQVISFDDVWSQRDNDSNTVCFDVIAHDMDSARLQGECEASVKVFQESFESRAVTLNLKQNPITEASENSRKDHRIDAAKVDDQQLVQPSSSELPDQRLRQPLGSPQSKQAWKNLLELTDIQDNDVMEHLTNHTQWPQALALDLFFAVHDTNEDAIATLEKHEIHIQKNRGTLNKTTASGGACGGRLTQTKKVKNSVISKMVWVKNKFQRKSSLNEIETDPIEGESDKQVANTRGVSQLNETYQEGILNPSFDGLGLDNLAYQESNSRTGLSEQHEFYGSVCSNSLTIMNTATSSPSTESPIAGNDPTSEETMAVQTPNEIPAIHDHLDNHDNGYVRLGSSTSHRKIKQQDSHNLTVIEENRLGTFGFTGIQLGEQTNKQPVRTFSTVSKDSGFGTFERNNSDSM